MKLRVWAATNKVGSNSETEIEIDDEDLEGLSPRDRDALLEDYAQEAMWSLIEWGWNEKEGESS